MAATHKQDRLEEGVKDGPISKHDMTHTVCRVLGESGFGWRQGRVGDDDRSPNLRRGCGPTNVSCAVCFSTYAVAHMSRVDSTRSLVTT